MGEALSAMGINLPFLISQVVNFLILFGALTFLLWKPVRKRMDERQEMLKQQESDAAAAAKEREAIEDERQKVLESAREEADQIIADAYERVEAIKKDAESDAEKIKEAAKESAREEEIRALKGVRDKVAPIAIAAAQKLIGTALDEARQRTLLDEFFSQIKAGKVVALEGMQVEGDTVEVTSALPLLEDEQKTIKKDLGSKIGKDISVKFTVNPDILGGMIIKVDDKVYDHSVSGQLAELKSVLN